MTEEQYIRAVEIYNRIGELEKAKEEIKEKTKHRLWYACQVERGWMLTSEWVMRYISKILDKHDLMIRQEIDEEIEKLKKEIKTL